MARRRATVVSQAPGRAGTPWAGQVVERAGIGVLDALLGQVDVPGDAHRRGEHEGPLATVRVGDGGLDRGVHRAPAAQSSGRIGRTSTPPNGAGISLARAMASSRSAASMR